ncbi:type II toxin-antitoxin system VapC family toxin [candidate division KSB1 bacterium]|nr:type II toxin-antitoxin system VapC family toxin [candidate division KSB1 bacterium]
MVLVDTSVWVDHLKNGNIQLEVLLNEDKVNCHEFIIGELACGNMSKYDEVLSLLQVLPHAKTVNHDEVLMFIQRNKLSGQGVGYIDVCLLASCRLSDLMLWTYDKKLEKLAIKLNLAYK